MALGLANIKYGIGLQHSTVANRIKRGLDPFQALTTPVGEL